MNIMGKTPVSETELQHRPPTRVSTLCTFDIAVAHVIVVLLERCLQIGLRADLDVALAAGTALAGQGELDAGRATLDVHVVWERATRDSQ